MRPLTLTLNYFGPFRHQTVDFTAFSDFPVFLISGKTGAGKTTIFDGMCFALFGGTSGGDRQVKQMRSDFATFDDQTEVTFTFEHQDQTFKIVRSPEQEVAKKRGSGTHLQKAAVELTVFDASGQEVDQLKKVNAVQTYIHELLQLTREQFSQIVLLPQGQFRQFLMANSDDKEKVLRDIFGTSLYSRWAQQLKGQLKAQQEANRDVTGRLTTLQSQLQWQHPEDAEGLAPQAAVDAQSQEQAELRTQLATRKQALDAADAALTSARSAQTAGETLQHHYQRQTHLQAELGELTSKAAKIDAQRQQVAALESVQAMAPAYQQRQDVQHRIEMLTQQVSELTDRAATLTTQEKQRSHQLQALTAQKAAADARQAQITTLTAQRPVYEQLARTQADHARAQQRLQEQQHAVSYVNKQLATVTAERERLTPVAAELTTALTQQRELDQRRQSLRELTQQAALVRDQQRQLDQLTATVTTQTATVATCRQTAQTKLAAYQQLDSRWASAQIAILSKRLLPGQACPVCGSTEHPHPAPTDQLTVTEDEVKAAQRVSTDAGQRLAAAENQLSADQTQLATAQTALTRATTELTTAVTESLGTPNTPATVTQRLATASQQLKREIQKNEQQVVTAKDAQRQLETLTKQQQEVSDQVTQTTATLTTYKEEALKLATRLNDLEQQRSADYPDLNSLNDQIDKLGREQRAFQDAYQLATDMLTNVQRQLAATRAQLTTIQAQLVTAQQNERQQTDDLTAAMQTNWQTVDFDRLTQLMAQLHNLAPLRQAISNYEQRQSSLTGQLKAVQREIGQQVQPDLEKLAAVVKTANTAKQAAQQAYSELDQLLTANQRLVEQMQATLATARKQQTQLAEMAQLANVANGSGPQKLSLERFVLQTYLQKVLQTGNQRLQQLTRGRYRFQLDQQQGTYRNGTGLEINVYDDNAGKVRSVHTLSGGESFVAALSLALALAMVIQEQSGGIKIDALFIDEGFGSLDEEALDMAMETLQRVEGQSRMIGIISHVSELEEQLPAQLQVIPQGNGESVVKYQLGFA